MNQPDVATQQHETPKIGANERAILDKIPLPILRRMAERVLYVKMRLQFTGWLQYMLPIPLAVVMLAFGGIAWLLGWDSVSRGFGALVLLLLAIFVFDIVTVKYRIHPAEPLPRGNTDTDFFDLMRMRHSCRSFQARPLTPEHLDYVLDAAHRYRVESDMRGYPIRFEYIAAPLTVWPVVNATAFLVAVAPRQYQRMAVIEVGRSLQKVVMDATRLGIATCWIGPGADQSSVIEHLGDRFNAADDHVICVCALGYESQYAPLFVRIFSRVMRRRLPLEALFFADVEMNTPLDLASAPFNRFGRAYEACQWSPSSYNGQTTRCVAVQDGDFPRFDFYAVTASRYYAAVALGIWCANWEMSCVALGIIGEFKVLPEMQTDELPKYDISWVGEAG